MSVLDMTPHRKMAAAARPGARWALQGPSREVSPARGGVAQHGVAVDAQAHDMAGSAPRWVGLGFPPAHIPPFARPKPGPFHSAFLNSRTVTLQTYMAFFFCVC